MNLDPSFIWTAFIQLLSAVPTTLKLTLVSMIFGLLIGTIIALIRIYRVPVLNQVASTYVTVIRSTPMLTHLLLIYYGLPILVNGLSESLGLSFRAASIPMIGFAYLSFSITFSAYLSEVVRSGMLAVDRGQIEAAYAVGMTTSQALRRIVLPQAFVVSLPNLTNSLIGALHGSTIAFTVSVVDINAKAQIIASTNWNFLEAFLGAAILFWGLTVLIERLSGVLEKRINVYNRGGVA
ncbi:cysteine ABC transporter permease [Bacillus sp. FJAT-27264]|uniref:amino acid ABC transporter permease n=1 Tax=Paenibacillus sp. (strain DSM 101736 / FJAT-27264) TaxID=1850362 RepID=UPI000808094B|nr:amino acid ABC transporter permease [Bacillus sp. FJAT-27264]OBZ16141.1 cysteine ABC transporter permease [Bacillus sp. FJAT-27264]